MCFGAGETIIQVFLGACHGMDHKYSEKKQSRVYNLFSFVQ